MEDDVREPLWRLWLNVPLVIVLIALWSVLWLGKRVASRLFGLHGVWGGS